MGASASQTVEAPKWMFSFNINKAQAAAGQAWHPQSLWYTYKTGELADSTQPCLLASKEKSFAQKKSFGVPTMCLLFTYPKYMSMKDCSLGSPLSPRQALCSRMFFYIISSQPEGHNPSES